MLLVHLWSVAAIWIDGPTNRAAAVLSIVVYGVAAAGAARLGRGPVRRVLLSGVPFVVVVAWWLSLAPSNDREWLRDVAKLPRAEIDGDRLVVHNVRNFEYRSEEDYTERWETREYDLSKLQGVDLFLSYWGSPHIAHTIASWDFGDGRPLAISIETRKEVGEAYSAVLGFFRQFEVYYVVADERDLVGLRTNHRGETVYLYRLTVRADVARAILLDYFEEINALGTEPVWYNAASHNCTTTIRHHVQHVARGNPLDWRLLVNGYIDEMGYERGNLDTRLPFEELRARSEIGERARAAGDALDFSRRIREGLPGARGPE
ncbi:MAG: DUF4105 domain-containing protein [bacterium]|nr:DUF4105 domain-containing protein [bacterium]